MSSIHRTMTERVFDLEVGRRIERARKRRGLTAVGLARRLGISSKRLYYLETGGRCSLFLAVAIAAELGVNLAELGRK